MKKYPRLKCEEEVWMNSEAPCWYCKKIIPCECMDATCWVCQRPYSKDRCREFGFDNNGETLTPNPKRRKR